MKNVLCFILVAVSFLLISCDKEEQPVCCDFEIDYQVEYDLYSTWALVGMVSQQPLKEECVEGVGGYITFLNNGTFSGAFSCNTMGGEFELVGVDEIKIINSFQTLKGCIGNESAYWEDTFSRELKAAGRFEIDGNRLTLYTSSQNRLIFKAIDL